MITWQKGKPHAAAVVTNTLDSELIRAEVVYRHLEILTGKSIN